MKNTINVVGSSLDRGEDEGREREQTGWSK